MIIDQAFLDPALMPSYEDLSTSLEQAGLDPSEPVSYEVKPDERILLRTYANFEQHKRAVRVDDSGETGPTLETPATEVREKTDKEARRRSRSRA